MRRLSLSTKLFVAALPLLIAVAILLTISVTNDFAKVREAERGAQLGSLWDPLLTTIQAVEGEKLQTTTTPGADMTETRRATDEAVRILNNELGEIAAIDPLTLQVGEALGALGSARSTVLAADDAVASRRVATQYDLAKNNLIAVGDLLVAEADDTQLGRELTAVAALATMEQISTSGFALLSGAVDGAQSNILDLGVVQAQTAEVSRAIDTFQSVAPEAWLAKFREAGISRALDSGFRDANSIIDAVVAGQVPDEAMTSAAAEEFVNTLAAMSQLRDELASEAVARSTQQADDERQSAYFSLAVILVISLVALLIALLVTRSITRRVRAVSDRANEIAQVQLPTLVEALRDPKGKVQLPEVSPIDDRGHDEVGELAGAFNSMQSTLVEVAHEQVEVLRRGVSDIFVTMARRNRSLVDRQLALLDELEAEVEDSEVLANYYRLDHLATRMRRNSESLLVLANTESKRRRMRATDIDDVVRAALGEIEDYRRIDVLNLDPIKVSGAVVADVSHMMAELFDNATSFSPPDSRVEVSGRVEANHYVITVSDTGVGIGAERLDELNDLLEHPPIVGLSVEPTLGMSVVSLLAAKHGVNVSLTPRTPGVTVQVVLPAALYGGDSELPVGNLPTLGGAAAPVAPIAEPSEALPTADLASAPIPTDTPTLASEPRRIEPTYEPTAEPAYGQGVVEPTYELTAQPIYDQHIVEPTYESTVESRVEPTVEPVDDQPAPTSSTSRADGPGDWSMEELSLEELAASITDDDSTQIDEFEFDLDAAASDEQGGDPLPPPDGERYGAEFDRPPSQPFGDGTSPRTITLPDAVPLPSYEPLADPEIVVPSTNVEPEPRLAPAPAVNAAGLPVRARGAAAPDAGTDRLADERMVAAAPPTSLQNALSRFEAGRNGQTPSLPTRSPGGAFTPEEDALSTSQSRLDPDAIRQRLRAFQTEFKVGRGGDEPVDRTDGDHDGLGGDR